MIAIRKAEQKDTIRVIRSIQNKKLDYNTPAHVKYDIANSQMFVAVNEKNEILGACSLVFEKEYNYTAIKRFNVFNKKNRKKGIGQIFMNYFLSLNLDLGASPWAESKGMIRLLEKNGFHYKYTYLENYNFYFRSATC